MSIREQIEDARFLAAHDRYIGALTFVMLAVSGSSRKMFPKPASRSLTNPKKEMYDNEAFTLFLGGQISNVLNNTPGRLEYGRSGMWVTFKDESYEIEQILYEFYRCTLAHEGGLPENVEFVPPKERYANRSYAIGISGGDKIALDYGWIEFLIMAVEGARCNGAEFGVKHYDFIPRTELDEKKFSEDVALQHGSTTGRFGVMKEAARLLSDTAISQATDAQLVDLFAELFKDGRLNSGSISGLSYHRLVENPSGKLLPSGISMLRAIAEEYTLVEV